MNRKLRTRGPRYLMERADAGWVEMKHAHNGAGSLRVKLFFHGDEALSANFAALIIPPGASEGMHHHKQDGLVELYYVLEGAGIFCVDAVELPLNAGDAVLVADAAFRGIRNDADAELKVALMFGPPAPAPNWPSLRAIVRSMSTRGRRKRTAHARGAR